MKKGQLSELKSKTLPELNKQAEELRHEIKKLSPELLTGKLKNTNLVKNKKKDIARILTFKRAKELS